jgi:hypothetical protein
MKIKEVTLHKTWKMGMANYSNITAGLSITWELAESDVFDFDQGWDMINQQLSIQSGNIDPAWVTGTNTKEYKTKYKTTITYQKKAGENV